MTPNINEILDCIKLESEQNRTIINPKNSKTTNLAFNVSKNSLGLIQNSLNPSNQTFSDFFTEIMNNF